MNAVATAIYSKLTGDATLIALLASSTSVYERVAPEGATMPYVVFFKSDARPRYTLKSRSHIQHLYTIKAVTESPADAIDGEPAGDIDERIDTLLGTDGTLTISGRTLLYCRRREDMPDYDEKQSDRVFLHRGGIYEIWSA